jgi:hypothetical protein
MGMVTHTYNPSYLVSGCKRIEVQSQLGKSMRSCMKANQKQKDWCGVSGRAQRSDFSPTLLKS